MVEQQAISNHIVDEDAILLGTGIDHEPRPEGIKPHLAHYAPKELIHKTRRDETIVVDHDSNHDVLWRLLKQLKKRVTYSRARITAGQRSFVIARLENNLVRA